MLAALLLLASGCAMTTRPSNYRDWSPDQAQLPTVELKSNQATVRNVRCCRYMNTEVYLPQYEDRVYDLDQIKSVDFIVVPFTNLPMLAHTMLSFGFNNGEHLAVSVEIRKEKGEEFGITKGFVNGYEIMYVAGDESDLVKLRTHYRLDDVYVYATKATPDQARKMLISVAHRMNQLAETPEYYNTLTNNCTSNIVEHVNELYPDRVPFDLRTVLPGYSAELAYELGLLVDHGSFAETKRRARINELAYRADSRYDFSQQIRLR